MIKVDLKTLDIQRQMDENALLDCSATGLFMDTKWAKGNFISVMELEQLILVYNVDGSHNSIGSITHEATLIMIHKGHREKVTFEICDLEKVNLIIEYTWLKKHNPEIDWSTGEIEFTLCPSECNMAKLKKKKAACKARAFKYKASVEEVEDEEDEECSFFEEGSRLLRKLKTDKVQMAPIQDKKNPRHIYELINQQICSLEKKLEKTAVELIPPQYHVYLDVFEKKALECMPLCKPWDHAIDLVPDFKPIFFFLSQQILYTALYVIHVMVDV